MQDEELIRTITTIVKDFGLWVFFAWLFFRERDAHNETIRHRIDDLREQAGYKSNFASKAPKTDNDVN